MLGRSVAVMSAAEERPGSLAWKVHGERSLYDNPWVRLVKVDVQPPGGSRFEHHVVRLQRVAVVLDELDRVLMLWRHRFVDDSWGWDCPAASSTTARTLPRPRPARSRGRPAGGPGR